MARDKLEKNPHLLNAVKLLNILASYFATAIGCSDAMLDPSCGIEDVRVFQAGRFLRR